MKDFWFYKSKRDVSKTTKKFRLKKTQPENHLNPKTKILTKILTHNLGRFSAQLY